MKDWCSLAIDIGAIWLKQNRVEKLGPPLAKYKNCRIPVFCALLKSTRYLNHFHEISFSTVYLHVVFEQHGSLLAAVYGGMDSTGTNKTF